MNSAISTQLVSADIAEGNRLGIDGAPAVYLNGRQVYDLRASNLNFLIKYLAH